MSLQVFYNDINNLPLYNLFLNYFQKFLKSVFASLVSFGLLKETACM